MFFLSHQNAKDTDPGHLRNFKFIFCVHFDEKFRGTPKGTGRVSCQSSGVGGGCYPENLKSQFFLTKFCYLHAMELQLTGYARTSICLMYKQKIR